MTDDLDDRLRDLVSVAGTQGRLPSAAELRRRGDHRRRVQQVTVGALALIVIGGSYTVGAGRVEVDGNRAPAGQPTVSIAPTPTPTSTSKSDLVRQQKLAADKASTSAKKLEAVKSAGRLRPGSIRLSGPTARGERRFVQVAPNRPTAVDARGEPGADATRFTLRSAGADTFLVESKTTARCLTAEPNVPLALADCDIGIPSQRFVFSYRGSRLYTIGTPSGHLTIDPTSLNIGVTDANPTIFTVTADQSLSTSKSTEK